MLFSQKIALHHLSPAGPGSPRVSSLWPDPGHVCFISAVETGSTLQRRERMNQHLLTFSSMEVLILVTYFSVKYVF